MAHTDGGKVRNSHVNSRWDLPQILSRTGAEKDLQQHAREIASLQSPYLTLDVTIRRISSTSKRWCMFVEGGGERHGVAQYPALDRRQML